MDDGLTDDECRVWRPFLLAATGVEAALDRLLVRHFGIDHLDFRILVRLAARPEWRMRMSELAFVASVDRSKMSYRVKRLERLGLVLREAHADDQRGVNARLTDRGREVLGAARPVQAQAVRQLLLNDLSDVEHSALESAFGRLIQKLHLEQYPYDSGAD